MHNEHRRALNWEMDRRQQDCTQAAAVVREARRQVGIAQRHVQRTIDNLKNHHQRWLSSKAQYGQPHSKGGIEAGLMEDWFRREEAHQVRLERLKRKEQVARHDLKQAMDALSKADDTLQVATEQKVALAACLEEALQDHRTHTRQRENRESLESDNYNQASRDLSHG